MMERTSCDPGGVANMGPHIHGVSVAFFGFQEGCVLAFFFILAQRYLGMFLFLMFLVVAHGRMGKG